MKKQLIIGFLVLVALIALAYFLVSKRPMTNEDIVKNALMGSGSASCIITTEEGDDFDFYAKNGMIKMSGGIDEYEFFLVSRDGTVYIWDNFNDNGMSFSADKSIEMGVQRFDDNEEFIKETKDQITNCSVTPIPDDFFEIPEEIIFYREEDFFFQDFDFDPEEFDLNFDDIDFEELEYLY